MRALPAGPRRPGWAQTLAYSLRPYGFLLDCASRFGDTFTVRLAGMGEVVAFSAPEAVRAIFALPPRGLHNANDVVRYLLDERSVIFLEGAEHKHMRKLLSPPLHGRALASYRPRFLASVDRVSGGWREGRVVDLHKAFQKITFDALLDATIGREHAAAFDALRGELLSFVRGQLTAQMFLASVALGPRLYHVLRGRTDRAKRRLSRGRRPRKIGLFAQRAANLARVEHLLQDLVRQRRRRSNGGEDALSRLVAAKGLNDRPVSNHDIVQQLLTLLIAGHDTTSLALSFAIVQILERPQLVEQLRSEISPAVDDDQLDAAAVSELPFLDAVVNESLRLTPGASLVPRRFDDDLDIGGTTIPAGTYFAANVVGAHHRAATWGDPDRFRPERFLGEKPTPWTFLPFGGGIRRCLGAAFAQEEMRLVLARLLSRFEFRLVPGYQARPAVHGFLIGPAAAVRAEVRLRHPRAHAWAA